MRGPSFEYTWIPWRKGALNQVWLKFAHWMSLFWRGCGSSEFPYSNKYLIQLVKFPLRFLKTPTTTMKKKHWNFHQKNSLESSLKEIVIFHFHLSLPELKSQVSFSDRLFSVVILSVNFSHFHVTKQKGNSFIF